MSHLCSKVIVSWKAKRELSNSVWGGLVACHVMRSLSPETGSWLTLLHQNCRLHHTKVVLSFPFQI